MPTTLSEADSKALLTEFGIPFAAEILATTAADAGAAAQRLGFPVAIKLCGDNVAHKTERGLVRLGVGDVESAIESARQLLDAAVADDMATGVLVSPMIRGSREFIAGMSRDAQFGPTVVFGIGGILTEVLDDAVVGLAPLGRIDAEQMIDSIHNDKLLAEFRGEPAVDRAALVDVLMALSTVALERSDIESIDLNPLIITDGVPVAVDALVEVAS